MQPLRGPREHPEPDTHRAVGNRAPASPAPTSHWQPTAAGAAVPGAPESENSQVRHKPGCEAAWRSPWHAPRGVSGRLILIIMVLSLPGPVQAQASPGHETCTGLPPCRAVLGRLRPACRENLHPDCQAQQHLEAFPLLSTK